MIEDTLISITAQMTEGRLRDNLADPDFVNPIEERLERLYQNPNRVIALGTRDVQDLNTILAIKVIYIDNKHDDPLTIMYIARILDNFGNVTGSTSTGQTTLRIYFDDIMNEKDETKKRGLCKRAGDQSLFEVGINPTASDGSLRDVIWTGRMGYNYLAKGGSVQGHMKRVYGELYEANNFYVDMMRQIGDLLIGRPCKQILKKLWTDALIDSKTSTDIDVCEAAVRNVLKYEEILRKSGQDK